MSQTEGRSTPPHGGDENQSHIQPEKSPAAADPEADSQEVNTSSLSTFSLAMEYLEEVKPVHDLTLHKSSVVRVYCHAVSLFS